MAEPSKPETEESTTPSGREIPARLRRQESQLLRIQASLLDEGQEKAATLIGDAARSLRLSRVALTDPDLPL